MAGDCYCCVAICYVNGTSKEFCEWGVGTAASKAATWLSDTCPSDGSINCAHVPDERCE